MYGRRYNEGLHQAIEAKEGVKIARESKTLATITFQNFFRLYNKLSGMTGTAMTEESEFSEIYKLDVVEIPTNKPMIREDCPDVVYKTEKGKFNAVINDIIEHHEKGQPVLVGTITIEKSEQLSAMLKRRGIKHEVLNAKYHEKEAEIVAQAGRKGAVTIATNMAGRGTDILLGGNAEFMARAEMRRMQFSEELIGEASAYGYTDDEEILNARKTFAELNKKYKAEIAPEAEEVRKLGGLYIIGTERHESRRIDNQLRGRAGRQGDPGKSRFYISLEDDLMRLFGGDRIQTIMDRLNVDEDMPIEASILSNTIENAQKKVEGRNFAIRKNVLQYDDVMNRQREIIYEQRDRVLNGDNVKPQIMSMIDQAIEANVKRFLPENTLHDDFDTESIDGTKVSLMGPMSGIGDAIFWGCLRVIAAGIGINIAMSGSPLGAILFLLIYNIPSVLCRYFMTYLGFTLGTNFISQLYEGGLMRLVTRATSTVGLTMIGAMTAANVKFTSIISFPVEGSDPITLQSYLDQIFLGLVPLCLTLFVLWLMRNKNVNVNVILVGIMVLAIVLGLIGVM